MPHMDVQMPRRPWMAESSLSHEGERGKRESSAFDRANAERVQPSGRTLSEAKGPTLPSALSVFTSEFEKGSGGSHSLLPPGKLVR